MAMAADCAPQAVLPPPFKRVQSQARTGRAGEVVGKAVHDPTAAAQLDARLCSSWLQLN